MALWESRDSLPRYLLPKDVPSLYYRGNPDIALLENAAVFTYSGIKNGYLRHGLEVYFFPEPASAQGVGGKTAVKATAAPLWPQTGAPEPTWTFRHAESGGLEAVVDLGAGAASGETPQVEWSEDLKVWQLLPEVPPTAGNSLQIPLPSGSTSRGFLRLRTSGGN